jgi:hypothetical protein
MVKRIRISTLLGIFLLAGCFPGASWAETSGCVTCHTDEGMLKSLHKPIKIEAGEGEG